MANGWTPERKARMAELIRTWRPWEHSTGPRSAEGKSRSARNADKGGHREMLRALTRAMSGLLREQREARSDLEMRGLR
jgi:hypothetical protein